MKNGSSVKIVMPLLFCGLIIAMAGCKRMENAKAPGERVLVSSDYEAKAEAPASAPKGSALEDETGKVLSAGANIERMLIAKVALTVEVKDIKNNVRRAEQLASQFGGYVSDSRIYTEESSSSATLTLMIPIKSLDLAVAKMRELGKVRYEQKSTEDVTRQFIDNEARIKNLQKEEEALAALLKRTGKLSDILEVEQELARVRTEIDQIQGEQRYLKHQSSFSTVTLNLTTRPEPVKYEGSPLKVAFFNAWHAFRVALHGLAVIGIYAVFFVPLIIFVGFILYLVFKLLGKLPGKKKTG